MFNRRLLIDSGGHVQMFSALEIHVETSDGSPITSARVEISYNGKANVSNTDNKGISVFYGVPTGTEISYTVTAAGYNTKQGSWTIDTDVEYATEYVVLTKPSITYTIMMGIAIGGTASSNKDTAAEGEQVIFTAMPDVGSEFLNWEIIKDGETTPAIIIDNPLTYTMPAKNIIITPNFNEDIIIDPPVNAPTGVINVPAEGATPVPFTFTVPQNINVLEAITTSSNVQTKTYIGVTAEKTYTWYTYGAAVPSPTVTRVFWQLRDNNRTDNTGVLIQTLVYINGNVGSGASVLSYSEAINKISPTITAY